MATELEKQVNELKAELTTLREALDRTFRAIGSGAEWHYHRRQAIEINAASLAAAMNKAAPQPQSTVMTVEDLKGIKRELFGTDEVSLTVEQIAELKAK